MRYLIIHSAILTVALSTASARQYSGPELRAMFTFMPFPEYPYKLRFVQHMGGSGMFRMIVDERGKVTAVTTLQSTGHPELDAEASKGLMRWKARPGQKREVDIPVTFDPWHVRQL
jgi:TonB family protein